MFRIIIVMISFIFYNCNEFECNSLMSCVKTYNAKKVSDILNQKEEMYDFDYCYSFGYTNTTKKLPWPCDGYDGDTPAKWLLKPFIENIPFHKVYQSKRYQFLKVLFREYSDLLDNVSFTQSVAAELYCYGSYQIAQDLLFIDSSKALSQYYFGRIYFYETEVFDFCGDRRSLDVATIGRITLLLIHYFPRVMADYLLDKRQNYVRNFFKVLLLTPENDYLPQIFLNEFVKRIEFFRGREEFIDIRNRFLKKYYDRKTVKYILKKLKIDIKKL